MPAAAGAAQGLAVAVLLACVASLSSSAQATWAPFSWEGEWEGGERLPACLASAGSGQQQMACSMRKVALRAALQARCTPTSSGNSGVQSSHG